MSGKKNEFKGREFTGLSAGKNYDRNARLIGLGPRFYQNAIGELQLQPGMRALDLACGTGSLTFALAARSQAGAQYFGCDLSAQQLARAIQRAEKQPDIHFIHASADALDFPDAHFDLIMTSMALHEMPPSMRHAIFAHSARMLKPGGKFLLVDVARPRFGPLGLLCWLPMRLGKQCRDNWTNAYADIAAAHGWHRLEDNYLNSLVRRQLFAKTA